jgi:two-component system NtrC family response regulator
VAVKEDLPMSAKIRLLIVDDEVRFLQTLTQRLSMRDFAVTPVKDGDAAISAARTQEFDIAIVDLRMPGMSGEQVIEILKQEHPLLEVIILTGHGSIDSAVFCTRTGSYGYLQKPCDTEELLNVLREAYQRRVQRKLRLDEDRMNRLLDFAVGESPLGILRRLRELDEAGPGSTI